MFFLDNNYPAIQKILEEGKIKHVEISTSQVLIIMEDDTKVSIDYAEYDGLDIKAEKIETEQKTREIPLLTEYDKELLRIAKEKLKPKKTKQEYKIAPKRLTRVNIEESPTLQRIYKELGLKPRKDLK